MSGHEVATHHQKWLSGGGHHLKDPFEHDTRQLELEGNPQVVGLLKGGKFKFELVELEGHVVPTVLVDFAVEGGHR